MVELRWREERNVFVKLQLWYQVQCNGDWEHNYGIKIDTLDNPGWIVKIDLHETIWENIVVPLYTEKINETNWIQYHISKSEFIGCGSALNLERLIASFFDLIKS